MKKIFKTVSGSLLLFVMAISTGFAADRAVFDLGTVHFPDGDWRFDEQDSGSGTLLAVSSRGCLLRIDASRNDGLLKADELTEDALLPLVKGIFPDDGGSGGIHGFKHISFNSHDAVTFRTTGTLPGFAEIPLKVTLADIASWQLSFYQLAVSKKNEARCLEQTDAIVSSFTEKEKAAELPG